jgi:hypothetical protein
LCLRHDEVLPHVLQNHVVPQAHTFAGFKRFQGTPWMARSICAAFDWGVVHSVFAGFRFILCEAYPHSLLSKSGMS